MPTYTLFETEMLKIMKELKSEMNTRFDAVDTRFDRLEIWNDNAFVAIEDLTDEVRAEGAATRTMMYQAYNDIFELRDRLDTVPRSRTSRARATA